MFWKSGREKHLQESLEQLGRSLTEARGEADAIQQRLSLLEDYEAVKKALTDKEIELAKVHEDHARANREIEHKLGLHKIQVEQEKTAAVTEAKLAVREEALAAKEGRFQQEMQFMQKRFEDEVASQRKLVEQVLDRLPHFEHRRVEHIGVDPNPPQRLMLEEGE